MSISDMSSVKTMLHELATQAYGLAMGLQNAAPSQPGGPPKSVQYLLEVSLQVEKISKTIEEIMVIDSSKRRL